ncbi:unnamed protein product [Cochlearia groenlandica]
MERKSDVLATTHNRIYDEFEPISNLKSEQGFETLTVYLPGFKKEQLKVQVTTTRKLRVIGERPAGGSNKWIRFRNEFPIASNVDVDSISAKFEGANLVLKLPKHEPTAKQTSHIVTTAKQPPVPKENLKVPSPTTTSSSPPPPPPSSSQLQQENQEQQPPRRRERDSRERRDERDLERPPHNRRDRSPLPPPPRRDYKRRPSLSPPPPQYRDRQGRRSPPQKRDGLMSYKQFIQELEDDILPSEAERRYQEYKSEFITTQKRVFFNSHKEEQWLKDKYHPTNLLSVIERRNELAKKVAKDFLLDLQSGAVDLGPQVTTLNRMGAKEIEHLTVAPKAPSFTSEPKRILTDIEQAQALVRKLDTEKGIEENVLLGSENEKSGREKTHSGSNGPVIIIRGLTSVKGLEGVELLDTLVTYLWRIHGVDYYGKFETNEAKGLRHVRAEGKSSDAKGDDSEIKFDAHWQERLKGQDPLEVMAAKEKIDAASTDALDPHVRKIRDEKYGWKYGCGAKGCTKLFHAAEFVHKHLKLKHPELFVDLTAKVREELYLQNYMNDPNAPGGQPATQQAGPRDRPMRRKPGMENRLRDDRGGHRERDGRTNGNERMDWSEDQQRGDGDGNDAFGGVNVPSFSSDINPPPVLMPVPGAGPLGPFIPAPPEFTMQMFREPSGSNPSFEGRGRGGPTPFLLPPAFRQDPRRLRSYQDLDAPEDEVTVIDYRSL